jgi:hypothetical protein
VKPTVHYHVIVQYDGTDAVTEHTSFTAALDKARKEILIERLLDSTVARKLRRKFTRREFIPGVYAEWVGSSHESGADPAIRIEVSACTPALHP